MCGYSSNMELSYTFFLTLNFISGMLRIMANRKMKGCMNVHNLESKKLIFLYLSFFLLKREFSFLIYVFLYNTTFIYLFIFIFMFLIFKHCYNK